MPSTTTHHQGTDSADAPYLYRLRHDSRPSLPRHMSSGVEGNDVRLTRVTSLEDSISPLMLGKSKEVDEFKLDATGTYRFHPSSKSHRRRSLKQSTLFDSPQLLCQQSGSIDGQAPHSSDQSGATSKCSASEVFNVLTDMSAWIEAERAKQQPVKAKSRSPASLFRRTKHGEREEDLTAGKSRARGVSDVSDRGRSLDELEALVTKAFSLVARRKSYSHKPSSLHHRRSTVSLRKPRSQSLIGHQSDDTDYSDASDLLVPSCDVVLDNSKTMSYTGGASQHALLDESQIIDREAEAWSTFKYEIVRLAHTLKLKGWRRVPMERSSEISVGRLSGALTNAVYVVSPPDKVPTRRKTNEAGDEVEVFQKPPPNLLLRVYGPNVEHLIDRDSELQVLRRLAKKSIGPRLLATFANGRFEEYLHAKTLQPRDLRISDTSKQIAKRMRELHDGVELLDAERDAGPFVWQNWDKWVGRCGKLTSYIDKQILSNSPTSPDAATMKARGLVCGVEWQVFRRAVENYRKRLDARYGGSQKLKERLVFAHNDTQYGNILRLVPAGASPLLLPANQHKQLVVIDFEYANANVPGYEFANHFTEWCYNYHDQIAPHICNTAGFPSEDEQYRFVRSYVLHRPEFAPSASTTPMFGPTLTAEPHQTTISSARRSLAPDKSTSLSSMTSESRMPSLTPTTSIDASGFDGDVHESPSERQIQQLLQEASLWRVACHAQWIAWGIVQATVAGLDENGDEIFSVPEKAEMKDGGPHAEDSVSEKPDQEEDDSIEHEAPEEGSADEFDYLSYAQDRALFFWGDCLRLGVVRKDELPEDLVARAMAKVCQLDVA